MRVEQIESLTRTQWNVAHQIELRNQYLSYIERQNKLNEQAGQVNRAYRQQMASRSLNASNAIASNPIQLDLYGKSYTPAFMPDNIYGAADMASQFKLPVSYSGFDNDYFYRDVKPGTMPVANPFAKKGYSWENLKSYDPEEASRIYWSDVNNLEKAYLKIIAGEARGQGNTTSFDNLTLTEGADYKIKSLYKTLSQSNGGKPAAEWKLNSSQILQMYGIAKTIGVPDSLYNGLVDQTTDFFKNNPDALTLTEFTFQDVLWRNIANRAMMNGVSLPSLDAAEIPADGELFNPDGTLIRNDKNYAYLSKVAFAVGTDMGDSEFDTYYTDEGLKAGLSTGRLQYAELPKLVRMKILSDPELGLYDFVGRYGQDALYQMWEDPLVDKSEFPASERWLKDISDFAIQAISVLGIATVSGAAAAPVGGFIGGAVTGGPGAIPGTAIGYGVGFVSGAITAIAGMATTEPLKPWNEQKSWTAKVVVGADALADWTEQGIAKAFMGPQDKVYYDQYLVLSDQEAAPLIEAGMIVEQSEIDYNDPLFKGTNPKYQNAIKEYAKFHDMETKLYNVGPSGTVINQTDIPNYQGNLPSLYASAKIYRSTVYQPNADRALDYLGKNYYELEDTMISSVVRFANWSVDSNIAYALHKDEGAMNPYTQMAAYPLGKLVNRIMDMKLTPENAPGLMIVAVNMIGSYQNLEGLQTIKSMDELIQLQKDGKIPNDVWSKAWQWSYMIYNNAHAGTPYTYAIPESGEVYRVGMKIPVAVVPGTVSAELDPVIPSIITQLCVMAAKDSLYNGRTLEDSINTLASTVEMNVGANMQDFIGQGFLDPLEWLGAIGAGGVSAVAGANNHLTAQESFSPWVHKTAGEFSRLNKKTGVVETKNFLPSKLRWDYYAFNRGMSIGEGINRWASAVTSGHTIDDNKGNFSGLNWWQKRLAGVNVAADGTITFSSSIFANRSILDLAPVKQKVGAFAAFLSEMDPVSRAHMLIEKAGLSISTMLSTFSNPEDFVKFYNNAFFGDKTLIDKFGAKFMYGANVNTVLEPFKAAASIVKTALTNWNLAATPREIITNAAQALGMKNGHDLLEQISKDKTADKIIAKLTAIANDTNNPNSAFAQALLVKLGDSATASSLLLEYADLFNKKGVAYGYNQWASDLGNDIVDFTEGYAVDYYSIAKEARKPLRRYASALKAVQSVFLLGFSTTYPINNYLDNVVGRASVGVFGYMTPWAISNYMKRFGITPPRMREGVGEMGNTDAAHNSEMGKLGEALRQGDIPILSQLVRNIGKFLPGNWAASKIESMESTQAYAIGIRKGMDMFWARGLYQPNMPPEMLAVLNKISPEAVGLVRKAISSGLNMEEIWKMFNGVFKGTLDFNPALILDDDENYYKIMAVLEHTGLKQRLMDGLDGAKTPEEISAAMNAIRQEVADFIEMRNNMGVQDYIEHLRNRIATEGPRAVLWIYIDMQLKTSEVWIDSLMQLGDAIENMKNTSNSPESVQNYMDAMRQISRNYMDLNRDNLVIVRAMVESLGIDNDLAQALRASYDATAKIWNDAYVQKLTLIKQHEDKFRGQNTQEKWDDLVEVRKQIDLIFSEAFSNAEVAEKVFAKNLEDAFRDMYGDDAGSVFYTSWKIVQDYRKQMWSTQNKHRKAMEALTPEERAIQNKKFWEQTYTRMIGQYEKMRVDAAAKIDAAVRGRRVDFGIPNDVDNDPNDRYRKTKIKGQEFIDSKYRYSEDDTMLLIDTVRQPLTKQQAKDQVLMIDPRKESGPVENTYGMGEYNIFLEKKPFGHKRQTVKARITEIVGNARDLITLQTRSLANNTPFAEETATNKPAEFIDYTFANNASVSLATIAAGNSTSKDVLYMQLFNNIEQRVMFMQGYMNTNPDLTDQQMIMHINILKGLQREAFFMSQRYARLVEDSQNIVKSRAIATNAATKAQRQHIIDQSVGEIRVMLKSAQGNLKPKVAEAYARIVYHLFDFIARKYNSMYNTTLTPMDVSKMGVMQIIRHNNMKEAHKYTLAEFITNTRRQTDVLSGGNTVAKQLFPAVGNGQISDNALAAVHWQLVERQLQNNPRSVPKKVQEEHGPMSPALLDRSLAPLSVGDALTQLIKTEARNASKNSRSPGVTEQFLADYMAGALEAADQYGAFIITDMRDQLLARMPNNEQYASSINRMFMIVENLYYIKTNDSNRYNSMTYEQYVGDKENELFKRYDNAAESVMPLLEAPMFGYEHGKYYVGRNTKDGMERADAAVMTFDNLLRLANPKDNLQTVSPDIANSYYTDDPIAVERPSITVKYDRTKNRLEVVETTNTEFAYQLFKSDQNKMFVPVDIFYQKEDGSPEYFDVNQLSIINPNNQEVVHELGYKINGYGYHRGYNVPTKKVTLPGIPQQITQRIIGLFDTSNPTTLIHEIWHVMMFYTTQEQRNIFYKYLGYDPNQGQMTVEQVELFAKTGEAYTLVPKSVPDDVRSAFDELKNEFKKIYTLLTDIFQLSVKMPREVVQAFDMFFKQDLFDNETYAQDIADQILAGDPYLAATYQGVELTDHEAWRKDYKDEANYGFYSKAIRSLETDPQNKFSPEQLLGVLKKYGVKDEEISELGVKEFLDGKKSVNKSELLGWMNDNMPKIYVRQLAGDESEYYRYGSYQSIEASKDRKSDAYQEVLMYTKLEYATPPDHVTTMEYVDPFGDRRGGTFLQVDMTKPATMDNMVLLESESLEKFEKVRPREEVLLNRDSIKGLQLNTNDHFYMNTGPNEFIIQHFRMNAVNTPYIGNAIVLEEDQSDFWQKHSTDDPNEILLTDREYKSISDHHNNQYLLRLVDLKTPIYIPSLGKDMTVVPELLLGARVFDRAAPDYAVPTDLFQQNMLHGNPYISGLYAVRQELPNLLIPGYYSQNLADPVIIFPMKLTEGEHWQVVFTPQEFSDFLQELSARDKTFQTEDGELIDPPMKYTFDKWYTFYSGLMEGHLDEWKQLLYESEMGSNIRYQNDYLAGMDRSIHKSWSDYTMMNSTSLFTNFNSNHGSMYRSLPLKKNWPEVMAKRLIQYAIATGKDAVLWTTGNGFSDRLDKTRRVGGFKITRTTTNIWGQNLGAYGYKVDVDYSTFGGWNRHANTETEVKTFSTLDEAISFIRGIYTDSFGLSLLNSRLKRAYTEGSITAGWVDEGIASDMVSQNLKDINSMLADLRTKVESFYDSDKAEKSEDPVERMGQNLDVVFPDTDELTIRIMPLSPVGQAGLVNHYDKVLLQAFNKLLKKYGVKVQYHVSRDFMIGDSKRSVDNKDLVHHGFKITEEMKAEFGDQTLYHGSNPFEYRVVDNILHNYETFNKLDTEKVTQYGETVQMYHAETVTLTADIASLENEFTNNATKKKSKKESDRLRAWNQDEEQAKLDELNALKLKLHEKRGFIDSAHADMLKDFGSIIAKDVMTTKSMSMAMQFYLDPVYSHWMAENQINEDFAQLEYIASLDAFKLKPIADGEAKALSGMFVRTTQNGAATIDDINVAEANVKRINDAWQNRKENGNPFAEFYHNNAKELPPILFQPFYTVSNAIRAYQATSKKITDAHGTYTTYKLYSKDPTSGDTEMLANSSDTAFDYEFINSISNGFYTVNTTANSQPQSVDLHIAENIVLRYAVKDKANQPSYISSQDMLAIHDIILALREKKLVDSMADGNKPTKFADVYKFAEEYSKDVFMAGDSQAKIAPRYISLTPVHEDVASIVNENVELVERNGKYYSPFVLSPVEVMAMQLTNDMLRQAIHVKSPNATWYSHEYKQSIDIFAEQVSGIITDQGNTVNNLQTYETNKKNKDAAPKVTGELFRDTNDDEYKTGAVDELGNPKFTYVSLDKNGNVVSRREAVMKFYEMVDGVKVEGPYSKLSHFFTAITSIGTAVSDQSAYVNNLLLWRFSDEITKENPTLFPLDRFSHGKKKSVTPGILAVEGIYKTIKGAENVRAGVIGLLTNTLMLKPDGFILIKKGDREYIRVYKQTFDRKSKLNVILHDKFTDIDTVSPESATLDYLVVENTAKGIKSTAYVDSTSLPLSAAVLGPKLGIFYANLYGKGDYGTWDMWMMRGITMPFGASIRSLTFAKTQTLAQLAISYLPSRLNKLEAFIGPKITAIEDSIAAIPNLNEAERNARLKKALLADKPLVAAIEEKENIGFTYTELIAFLTPRMTSGVISMSAADYETLSVMLASSDAGHRGINTEGGSWAKGVVREKVSKSEEESKDKRKYKLRHTIGGFAKSLFDTKSGYIKFSTQQTADLLQHYIIGKTFSYNGETSPVFRDYTTEIDDTVEEELIDPTDTEQEVQEDQGQEPDAAVLVEQEPVKGTKKVKYKGPVYGYSIGIKRIATAENIEEAEAALRKDVFTEAYLNYIAAGKADYTIERIIKSTPKPTQTDTYLVTIEGVTYIYNGKNGEINLAGYSEKSGAYTITTLAATTDDAFRFWSTKMLQDRLDQALNGVNNPEEIQARKQAILDEYTYNVLEYYFAYNGKNYKKDFDTSSDAPSKYDRAFLYAVVDQISPMLNSGLRELMNTKNVEGKYTQDALDIRKKYKIKTDENTDVGEYELEVSGVQAQSWGLLRRPPAAWTHIDDKYVTSEDYLTSTMVLFNKVLKREHYATPAAFNKQPWEVDGDVVGSVAELSYQSGDISDNSALAGAYYPSDISPAMKEWMQKGTDSSYFKRWNDGNKLPLVYCYRGGFSYNPDPSLDDTSLSNFYGPGFYYTTSANDAGRNYANIKGPDRIATLYAVGRRLGYQDESLATVKRAAANLGITVNQAIKKYVLPKWNENASSLDVAKIFAGMALDRAIRYGHDDHYIIHLHADLVAEWYERSEGKKMSSRDYEMVRLVYTDLARRISPDAFFYDRFKTLMAKIRKSTIDILAEKIISDPTFTGNQLPTYDHVFDYVIAKSYDNSNRVLDPSNTKDSEFLTAAAGWESRGTVARVYVKMVKPFFANSASTKHNVRIVLDSYRDMQTISFDGGPAISWADYTKKVMFYLNERNPHQMDEAFGDSLKVVKRNVEDYLVAVVDRLKRDNYNNDITISFNDFFRYLAASNQGQGAHVNSNFLGFIVRAAGYDGIVQLPKENFPRMGNLTKDTMHFIVFDSKQVKNVFNRGTFGPQESNQMYQSSDTRIPTDYYDSQSGYTPENQFIADGYRTVVKPILSLYESKAIDKLKNQRATTTIGHGLSQEDKKVIDNYMNQLPGALATAKMHAIDYASRLRDGAMLNYNRKYGFDAIMQIMFPYEFWYTRSALNWFFRILDRPAYLSRWARINKYGAKAAALKRELEKDLPERLKGKVAVEAPWLPDFLGDTLYIDPGKQLIPPYNMLSPVQRMTQQNSYQYEEAYKVLSEWYEAEKYTPEELTQAANDQSGKVWDEAFSIATTRRKQDIESPVDLISAIFGVAWYITTPMKLAGLEIPGINKGGKETISETPMLRTSRAFETVTQDSTNPAIKAAGQLVGLMGKPEEWLRDQLDLPEFGEYGAYYVKRQIANMVIDGGISVDEALAAMAEMSGPIYNAAVQRVKLEQAMRVPLAASAYAFTHSDAKTAVSSLLPSLFSAGLLPRGELVYRGQHDEWVEAINAADNGNPFAIKNFFATYPQYASYLAKNKEPEDLLKSFMIGQTWDVYMSLDAEAKKKLSNEVMPKEFQTLFLDKATRDYDSLTLQTVADWAHMIGAYVPKSELVQRGDEKEFGAASDKAIELAAQGQATATGPNARDELYINRYYVYKQTNFPDISNIQQGYFNAPKSERPSYLIQYPKLLEYWSWSKQWKTKYPWLEPYFNGQAYQDYDFSKLSPTLVSSVEKSVIDGGDLPEGAYNLLRNYWVTEGRPSQDFDTWLDMILIPSIKNRMTNSGNK